MQNKGLVKLFAILFGLICIYQLSFTYVAGRVEDEAKAFAEAKVPNTQADYIAKREAIEAKYLDDKMGQDVFYGDLQNYVDTAFKVETTV